MHWKLRVLTTGLPGKSPGALFDIQLLQTLDEISGKESSVPHLAPGFSFNIYYFFLLCVLEQGSEQEQGQTEICRG